LPPPVIAGICIVYGFINYLFTAKGNLSNFILFFVASLFYNAFHELIFGKEFSRNESSVVMANVSNWMGLLYVGQLLLSGQFNSKNFQWTRIDSILTLFMIVLVFTSVIGWDFSHSLKRIR
jgi:hypothetical protein